MLHPAPLLSAPEAFSGSALLQESVALFVPLFGQEMPIKIHTLGEFPGGPVVRTLHFDCRGHGFDPWSKN